MSGIHEVIQRESFKLAPRALVLHEPRQWFCSCCACADRLKGVFLYSAANNTSFGGMPDLLGRSQIEEQLIARVHV
jgi:hypothetical protein